MKLSRPLFLGVFLLSVMGLLDIANAALNDNGNGTITQTRSDGSILMWLQDANIAGPMKWSNANSWIESLNNSNYLGYNDWRLPINLPVNGSSYDYNFSYNGTTDRGENITSLNSEMAYLWYVELENLSQYYPDGSGLQPGGGLTKTGSFINIQGGSYWSGTPYDPANLDDAYFLFAMNTGRQTMDYNLSGPGVYYSMAVRNAGVVPEPISSILFVTGGSLLAGRRLIRKNRS